MLNSVTNLQASAALGYTSGCSSTPSYVGQLYYNTLLAITTAGLHGLIRNSKVFIF
jgi:hypothetical protein